MPIIFQLAFVISISKPFLFWWTLRSVTDTFGFVCPAPSCPLVMKPLLPPTPTTLLYKPRLSDSTWLAAKWTRDSSCAAFWIWDPRGRGPVHVRWWKLWTSWLWSCQQHQLREDPFLLLLNSFALSTSPLCSVLHCFHLLILIPVGFMSLETNRVLNNSEMAPKILQVTKSKCKTNAETRGEGTP